MDSRLDSTLMKRKNQAEKALEQDDGLKCLNVRLVQSIFFLVYFVGQSPEYLHILCCMCMVLARKVCQ